MSSESLFKNCRACNNLTSKTALRCPKCGASARKLSLGKVAGIGFLVLVVLAIFGQSPDKHEAAKPAAAPTLVTLDYEWRTKLGGSIMEADIAIRNGSDAPIKDVRIECNHFAPSGTKIDSNSRTIYEIVRAHETLRKSDVNMGFINSQAKSSTCVIAKFTPVANH